jgi:hypothetical protein
MVRAELLIDLIAIAISRGDIVPPGQAKAVLPTADAFGFPRAEKALPA